MNDAKEVAVRLKGIRKCFPGTVANDRIDLEVDRGEVLALLGENGAGKTTLMRILYGMYQADEGELLIDGKPVTINSPHDAMNLGIGMIHQHFTLVPVHSVVENVMLGMDGPYDPAKVAREITDLGRRYGLEVDPHAVVRLLPVGMQQRVEILKAMIRGARILIMDEPTAVLTPRETSKLFDFAREFRAGGNSVIFITHKLNEVMEIADRITVLRAGRTVGSIRREEASESTLARMMVGRDLELTPGHPAQDVGDVILDVDSISVVSSRGNRVIDGLAFEIRAGEILGIAGVRGNGQAELAEVLRGLRKVEKGDIRVAGKSITNRNPLAVIAEGVGYIPSDRQKDGLVLDMTVAENLVLKGSWDVQFTSGCFLKMDAIEHNAERQIDEFSIKTPSVFTGAKALSGGNQQKVVVAREIAIASKLLVAVQPTRGLDLGATDYVHRVLLRERDEGKAVLLISTELQEIMSLSDRIGVMYRGSLLKVFSRENADIGEIGLLMTGVRGESNE